MCPSLVPNHVEGPAPSRVKGIGLHSGQPVSVSIKPGKPASGIIFLQGGQRIPAVISQLREADRGTTLGSIAVVEHLLAAAYGIGAYNLEVEVEGDELPALDGSALPWVEVLEKFRNPKSEIYPFALKNPIQVTAGQASIEALPYDGFKVHFVVDFPGVGRQEFTFDADKQSFKEEIAPARTFGYLEEYESLKARGLALGASPDNALVLNKGGYVNQPRFPEEVVRHKVLDLIGDLALLGRPLKAEIHAAKSGHRLNAELVRRILKE